MKSSASELGLTRMPILQNQAVHLMLFTQQKSYHFYTIEILFQTVKEVSNVKLVRASNANHLLHSSYPYPLDQREVADKMIIFNLFQKVSHDYNTLAARGYFFREIEREIRGAATSARREAPRRKK